MNQWTVTRQRPYYQNQMAEEPVHVVEVALGDINYTGSDMLVRRYNEERKTFTSQVEAVAAAIRIRDQWNVDDPTAQAKIGVGNTWGGMLEITPTDMNDDDLLDSARAYDEEYDIGQEDGGEDYEDEENWEEGA